MERQEVIDLFAKLRSAGLYPPSGNNPKQANTMIDNFLSQYASVTPQELEVLTAKLVQLPHWPRFFDINDILREIRKLDKVQVTVQQGKGKTGLGRLALGRDLEPGESWTYVLAEKCAKRHFKDASPKWITMNQLELATQCKLDYVCDICAGKSAQECSTGGHKPFLKIDRDSGLVVPYVNCDKCKKVFALPGANREEPKQLNRGGGFQSVAQITSRT